MKRLTGILLILLLSCAVLISCGDKKCSHSWSEWETVQEPTCKADGKQERVCSKCDEVDERSIDSLEHDWKDATCTTSKTCSKCGTLQGFALGHKWENATCETAKTCKTCGATEGSALGHIWNPATCTSAKVCETCGKSEGSALGHAYGTWIPTTVTVCGEDGILGHYHCEKCELDFDAEYKVIDDLTIGATEEHDYTDWQTIEAGTGCATVAYRVKICKKCGHEVIENDGDPVQLHPHDFELIISAPTCTEVGYEYRFECKNCGFVAAEKTAPALGHLTDGVEYQNGGDYHYKICERCNKEVEKGTHYSYNWTTVKKPDCYEVGLQTGTCYVCNCDLEKVLPKEHDFEYTETILEPTCTENGSELHTCSICGETKTVSLYKLGHNYLYLSTVEPATCTVGGIDLKKCSRCGDEKEVATSALDHDWDNGTVTQEPDCYNTGIKHFECTRAGCDATMDVVEPKKHIFDILNITTTPSCTEEGKLLVSCSVCQASFEKNLGYKHNTVHQPKHNATCTESGYYEYWHCADCDKYFSEHNRYENFSSSFEERIYSFAIETNEYKDTVYDNLIIKSFGHNIPEEFNKYDDNQHWRECKNNCGTVQDHAKHTLVDKFKINITESNGIYTYSLIHILSCTECDYYTEGKRDENGNVVPADPIVLTHIHNSYAVLDPVPATCTEDGLTAGLLCDICNEVLYEQEIVEALGHNLVDNVCTRCGLDLRNGTPGLKYTLNSDGNSYSCTGIGTTTDHDIVIAREYLGKPVTSIGNWAFYKCTSLTSVTIGNSVTSIGNHAFRYCSSLTSVTIVNSVTSIGDDAFSYCRNLTNVTIGNSVTSIGDYAFYNCDSLTSVTIPDSVSSIGGMAFEYCRSLTSVTIGNSVTSIGSSAFEYCYKLVEVYNLSSLTITKGSSNNGYVGYYALNVYTSLDEQSKQFESEDGFIFYEDGDIRYLLGYKGNNIEITLPENCNGKSYEIYKYAFYENDTLTSVVIPNSVTEIGDVAFYGCSSLTSVTIGNSVTSIGGSAFSGCSSLTSVVIGNSVTEIGGWAFCSCSKLTSVTIPDSVTSIGNGAFSGCSSLTSVTIGNSVTSIGHETFYECVSLASVTIGNGVTSIGGSAFSRCESLTSITVNENNTAYKSIDGNLYSKDGKTFIQYAIGKTATSFTIPNSVTSIGSGAFSGCSSLTSITIPDSVTSIGNYAFSDCSSLTSITIPDSVTSIGNYAFSDCSSLTSITIPDSVTSIGHSAFQSCSSLTSVTIGNSVTSIGYAAFEYCRSLTSVYITDIAKWCNISFCTYSSSPLYYADYLYLNGELITELVIPEGVTSIPYRAFSCKNVTNVVIPASVTSIGDEAFYGCSSLASVTIPNSVTSIGQYAFSGCSALTSVVIPDSVTSIGEHAFRGCSSLTNVTIANGVTEIGYAAFYGCSSLTSVTIPDSVTSIGNYAFEDCSKLLVKVDGIYYVDKWIVDCDSNVTSAIIREGTVGIAEHAFRDCSSLTSVTIPDSVTSISYYAFYGCSSLASVYYIGTEADWNDISISSYNSNLISATRYYYSENEPAEDGNFWHYDEDGNIVVW